MRRNTERGEGKLGAIVSLIVVLAVGYAAWNVAPAYIANGFLKDKMTVVCRSPHSVSDEKIKDMLAKYVREERLGGYLQRGMFLISTVESNRRISVTYERDVKLLPGWTKVLVFENVVDQPLIF